MPAEYKDVVLLFLRYIQDGKTTADYYSMLDEIQEDYDPPQYGALKLKEPFSINTPFEADFHKDYPFQVFTTGLRGGYLGTACQAGRIIIGIYLFASVLLFIIILNLSKVVCYLVFIIFG